MLYVPEYSPAAVLFELHGAPFVAGPLACDIGWIGGAEHECADGADRQENQSQEYADPANRFAAENGALHCHRRGDLAGNPSGSGTCAGCCRWARQPSSNSLTSLAEPNRRAGSFSSKSVDNGDEPRRQFRVERRHRLRRIIDQAPHRGHHRVGAERRNAGRHLVQHAAQAEQIGPAVERFAPRLFRRHVLRRAGDDSPAGQRDVVGGAGQAEVGEHGPLDPFLQQDVGRLHIAMHQSLLVRRRQPGSGLHADAEDFLEFEGALRGEPLGQRFAGHQRHDQERQPSAGLHLVDGQHVRMHDGRRRLRLAGEPLLCQRALRQMRRQHFDRHARLSSRSNALSTTPMPPWPMISSTS